jgi:L(+)-tartrate dehydratase subunit beta
VKEFGPLIVSIDTEGNNWFEQKKVEYNAKKEEVLESIYQEVKFIK